MSTRILRAALCAAALAPLGAQAHEIVGNRMFPATLAIDDPGVADELARCSRRSRTRSLPAQSPPAPSIPASLYVGDTFQIGVEAVIPVNRQSGTGIGVIGQLHLFFDDIFPNSIGRPILASFPTLARFGK